MSPQRVCPACSNLIDAQAEECIFCGRKVGPARAAADSGSPQAGTLYRGMVHKRLAACLGRERLWDVKVGENGWLCPYCGKLGVADLPPAPAARVEAVAAHLKRCPDWKHFTGTPRELAWLRRRARMLDVRQQVEENLPGNDTWRYRAPDGRWLCPFCAKPQSIRLGLGPPSQAVRRKVEKHLLECAAFANKDESGGPNEELLEVQSGRPAPVSTSLVTEVQQLLAEDLSWQVLDQFNGWCCPFCLQLPGIYFPRGMEDPAGPLLSVVRHLKRCPEYRDGEGKAQPPAAVRRAVAQQGELIAFLGEIEQRLVNDERWRRTDMSQRWLCPFCRRSVNHILLGERSAAVPVTVRLVGEHLLNHCPDYVGPRPAAGGAPEEAAPPPPVPTPSALEPREEAEAPAAAAPAAAPEAGNLQAIYAEVREHRSLMQSLKAAKRTQLYMLPTPPNVPGFEFASVYEACALVGGDFYDFLRLEEGGVGLVIGDVSGHGIDAGLIMTMAKKLISLAAQSQPTAYATLVEANKNLAADLPMNIFISVFLGFLETATRRFTFCRAGHNVLLLYNANRTPRLQLVESRGMAVGLGAPELFAQSLEEREIQLYAGDVILQYTDGVIEAANQEKVEFGMERLGKLVERHGNGGLQQLLDKIAGAVQDFRGDKEAADDITLVGFKVL